MALRTCADAQRRPHAFDDGVSAFSAKLTAALTWATSPSTVWVENRLRRALHKYALHCPLRFGGRVRSGTKQMWLFMTSIATVSRLGDSRLIDLERVVELTR